MDAARVLPGVANSPYFKQALLSQLGIIFMLSILFAWLKVGSGGLFLNRFELLLYWSGALLMMWSSFLLWSLLVGYIFKRLRLFNIVHSVVGAALALLVMEPAFQHYLKFVGVFAEVTSQGFLERLAQWPHRIYNNLGFITLWLIMNFVAWGVIVRRNEPLLNIKSAIGFFLLHGYWLLIKPEKLVLQAPDRPDRTSESIFPGSNIPTCNILALKAEDHYVRVFHAEGDELIYGRLVDAIDVAQGCTRGFRTHRSWWISCQGIDSASQGQLVWIRLKTGLKVPVSRSYRTRLREQLDSDNSLKYK